MATCSQNRERIYIVGFLSRKAYDKFHFPEKISLSKTISDCLEESQSIKILLQWKTSLQKMLEKMAKKTPFTNGAGNALGRIKTVSSVRLQTWEWAA